MIATEIDATVVIDETAETIETEIVTETENVIGTEVQVETAETIGTEIESVIVMAEGHLRAVKEDEHRHVTR